MIKKKLLYIFNQDLFEEFSDNKLLTNNEKKNFRKKYIIIYS